MVAELQKLYRDLNLDKLRVARPSKFIFLCGGVVIRQGGSRAENLRDYLCRVRPLRLRHEIVLAEKAVQLYRDTAYGDLISFEEDIARIASIVLVIAESPGALAELGSFSSNETIRQVLRVVIQERYESEESFVRFGPIERVKKSKRSYLGVYPWKVRRSGQLIVSTVKPHFREIKKFINEHADAAPLSAAYSQISESALFYLLYWIIHLCLAVEQTNIFEYVQSLDSSVTKEDVVNKLYCMKLAGWVGKVAYSGKDYLYTLHDVDPFDYSFKSDVTDKDSVRRKLFVAKALRSLESVPRHVLEMATKARTGGAS
ncbi:retron St85 family effector protein [Undibacter mobilis]|uniref:retron St85 family effector protein n=1 Tax=Undibacter mobilis TaxID=2292256 RepID=UPI0011C04671|nr:retron St85 family effector protein [Undibacter mobilis]